jgi:dipeptidyl aminopeptidase/acylaminoacyl peptidase
LPDKRVAAYGSWETPISASLVASGGVEFGQIVLDGDIPYWLEERASEAGRNVIVRRSADGSTVDMLPAPFNARSRVHEYGGGAYTVAGDIILFSNFADNRVYRLKDGSPHPLTVDENKRYADFEIDRQRERFVCVREDHSAPGEAVNTLVSVSLNEQSDGEVVVSGNDFYAAPRLSHDGSRLAWLTWCHPNMPWNGTELWVADFKPDGTLSHAGQVAGGPSESIVQPEWSPDGSLYFCSDRTGWWNLYRASETIEAVSTVDAEIGGPLWVFGATWYGISSDHSIACILNRRTVQDLALVRLASRVLEPLSIPYTGLRNIVVSGAFAFLQAASPQDDAAIVRVDLHTGDVEVLRRASETPLDPEFVSTPQEIGFPTSNGESAVGWFYPPTNKNYQGPDDDLPPLIVMSHGGPTSARGPELSPRVQFWTSRGFALLDVNYRGSVGFGRPYREALYGLWGVADVDDCAAGARSLAEQDLVDARRLIIRGGSAGGYTTLCALAFRDVFRAGASQYGIGDLEPFVTDTHKFESRYLDHLIGPYPERKDLYYERSPVHFADRISVPLILLQGLDDKVVPPNQAELMIAALESNGLPYAYVAFEGEGHGFRKAENAKRALEAELYFYSRVFGFELSDTLEPITIENLVT